MNLIMALNKNAKMKGTMSVSNVRYMKTTEKQMTVTATKKSIQMRMKILTTKWTIVTMIKF